MSNWPTENDPSNLDAKPVYDGWGWGDYWSAAEWISWHKAMRARYGLDHANTTFLAAWNGGSLWRGDPPLDARTTDSSFKAYAKENGFYDGLFDTGALAILAKPLAVGGDVVDSVVAISDGVKAAAKTTGTLTKYILPAVIVGAIAILAAPYAAPHVKKALRAIK